MAKTSIYKNAVVFGTSHSMNANRTSKSYGNIYIVIKWGDLNVGIYGNMDTNKAKKMIKAYLPIKKITKTLIASRMYHGFSMNDVRRFVDELHKFKNEV